MPSAQGRGHCIYRGMAYRHGGGLGIMRWGWSWGPLWDLREAGLEREAGSTPQTTPKAK